MELEPKSEMIQEMPVIAEEVEEEEEAEQQMPNLQLAIQPSFCSPAAQTPSSVSTLSTVDHILPDPSTCTDQTAGPPTTVSVVALDTTSEEQPQPPLALTANNNPVSIEYKETDNTTTSSLPIICAACHLAIKDRYLLQALDHYWHEDCLKCSCCDCRLGEVGSSLYTKAHLLLCKRDYLRLFGASGACTICLKTIPAFEMVMKVKSNVYHLECFACQQCRQRFCVGDKFYLCENRVLCEYDFEEQNLITSIQRGYNTLSHMRKQTETLSDISSGYGSPSPGTM